VAAVGHCAVTKAEEWRSRGEREGFAAETQQKASSPATRVQQRPALATRELRPPPATAARLLTTPARHSATSPVWCSMLGRALRHTSAMSTSQTLVRMLPGIHTKKAMCTARPSSLWQPALTVSALLMRHLYTSPCSEACSSSDWQYCATSALHARRSGGSSRQLACLRGAGAGGRGKRGKAVQRAQSNGGMRPCSL
jgi:hypothetical protein